jgi:hypothetical protein
MILIAAYFWGRPDRRAGGLEYIALSGFGPKSQPEVLHQVLASSPSDVRQLDIGLLNVLCAEGLPGAENLEARRCVATLDQWAERVKSETARHLYRFKANPREFDHSEGFFRMLLMSVVLYEDFSVRYNPALITIPADVSAVDHFFADSRDLFLHGLLAAPTAPRSERLGTCSSMPVLYVALGRRLGYPLKLVTTKSHLFIRWDSPTERFNVEATGKGMNRYDDEHFKRWPFPVTDQEIQADGYLKSLTPAEELALFLSLRGHCQAEAGRISEAVASYAEALRLAPNSRPYRLLLATAQEAARDPRAPMAAAPQPPATPPGSKLFQPPAQFTTLNYPPDPNPLFKLQRP